MSWTGLKKNIEECDEALRLSQIAVLEGLSIARQSELMSVSRSKYYYQAVGESSENLKLMRKIDEFHLSHPEWGYPRMTEYLRASGLTCNKKRVARLMKKMNIRSVLPKPNTSLSAKSHKKYPYLLRGLKVSRSNEVWATDITYIPMQAGFMYLTVVMDWYSRYVLSWRISNSMDKRFCLEALDEAWKWGQPEIFNSDQGAQFTSLEFTSELLNRGIKISMDGKGRALDNVFVERLWWSVKYEHIYLRAYENGLDLHKGLKEYFNYYNNHRLHSSLGYKTPQDIFLQHLL